MDKEKVLNLAKLARIKLSDTEAESLSHEFESILAYVGEVKEIQAGSLHLTANSFPIRNVMREDNAGHESGLYTDKILSEAPESAGDYIKVKKIL